MTGSHEVQLAFAARKAVAHEDYMAYVLTQYQRRTQSSEAELIASLVITLERYTRLMLCKVPDSQTKDYPQRVARIAAYTGAPTAPLVHILQTVNAPAVERDAPRVLPKRFSLWREVLQWFHQPFSRRNIRPALKWAALAAVLVMGVALVMGEHTPDVLQIAQTWGEVQFAAAGDDEWQVTAPSMEIKAGTQIRAPAHTTATFTLFEGSQLDLAAATQLTVLETGRRHDGLRTIVLQQDNGSVRFTVQPLPDARSRFEVRTPSTIIQVRGAEFVVTVLPDGATHVEVIEGVVAVARMEDVVTLHAGQAITVASKNPPQSTTIRDTPAPLPTASPTSQEPTPLPTATLLPPTATPEPSPTCEPPTATSQPEPTATQHALPEQSGTPGSQRPETPPGQENNPNDPPGQDNRPGNPPGQEKKP